jgi:hypothetical protein
LLTARIFSVAGADAVLAAVDAMDIGFSERGPHPQEAR